MPVARDVGARFIAPWAMYTNFYREPWPPLAFASSAAAVVGNAG